MNTNPIIASNPGIVVKVAIQPGEAFTRGQELIILEAMKMESAIVAPTSGRIAAILVDEGALVEKGDILINFVTMQAESKSDEVANPDLTERADRLFELQERKKLISDDARPEAVTKREVKNRNTARKNISLLVEEGTFTEYGGFIVAAQRGRRSEEDLMINTPADGLITGFGKVNSDFPDNRTSCLIMAYDYTVLAGTQGTMNHMKMDRMIALARERQTPVILFAEGGGGRPGDVDVQTIAGLFINTFTEFAGLRSIVPTISIVSGYCFAGNAALAGSSDIIIGTRDSSMGMGGPAMIEGGGLGKYHPSEVGPSATQNENGVIDIPVDNENDAIDTAKQLLGYWQGKKEKWGARDQVELQRFVPKNRKRTFDMRTLLQILLDEDSLLELRPAYARGLLTCFGRIEGIPFGLMANNSSVEAGAITAQNAQKAAQFLELCNRYRLPVVSLIDTPGIMVGPEAEKQGTVKAAGSLFIAGAAFQQPLVAVIIRRAYGLGAMAMMGGSTRRPAATISWPTGEFGAMGLEGAVQLGFRKELSAITDPVEREEMYQKMVDAAYERGKALSMATMFEIDNVIEPGETRRWICNAINK